MTTRLLKSSENINGLPIGFQEVEYLESTGTQYIDTNYLPKPTSTYKSTFQLTKVATTSGAWFCVFGSLESNNSTFTELFLPRASGGGDVNQILAGNHNSSYIRVNYPWAVNTKYSFEMTPTAVSVNGVSQGSISVDSSFTCSHSIYLFARHESTDAVRYYVSAKIHSFTIYEGNTLVRDFIPALNPAGRPCMYDLVGKKAYYNLGSGEFSYGRKIIPVEYLESTGTQYIDTGYYPNNNTKYNLKTQFLNPTTTQEYIGIIGVSVAPNDRCGMGFYNGKIRQQFGSGGAVYGRNYNDSSYTGFNNATVYECSRNGFYIEGTLNWTPTKDFTGTSSVTAWLFNTHAEAVYSGTPQKLFYCKIYDNEALIRDYIPCIDENNTPYMFDKVTRTCYFNVGTGTFNYGKKLYSSKVRLYKDSEANKLPAGFKRVEYLESTGTQYIDTGYAFTDNFSWEVTFDGIERGKSLFGGRTSTVRTAILYQKSATQGTETTCPIANMTGDQTPFQLADLSTGKHKVKMSVALNKGSVWVDDLQVYNEQAFTGIYISGTKQALFADNFGTSVSEYTSSKVYNLKMWQGSSLVLDFIPALDTTNTPCMYDTVTQTAFYNKGTGQFTYGAVIPNKVRLPQSTEIRFPVGYTEVEYLEGTGTQYIDTGYTLNNNSEIEIICNSGDIHGTNLFGYRDANASSRNISITTSTTASYTSDFTNSNYNTYHYTMATGGTNTVRITLSKYERGFYYLDGTLAGSNTALCNDIFTCGSSAYLMSVAGSPYFTECFKGKLYKCIIKEDGILIRNFIPALDPNGKPCMWDVVTKQPFYNQGTGEFTYGRSIQQVSYLESTGTQYIDTEIKPTDDYGYRIKNTYTVGQGEQCVIGCMDSGNRFVGIYTSGSANAISGAWGDYVGFLPNYTWTTGTILDVKCNYKNSRKIIIDNTEMKDISDIHITGTISDSIYIGARHYGSNITKMQGKIYGAEITKGTEIIADFVPAMDSNNVGFMFDRVTHTIFDNKGTGSFNYGSSIPNKIRN